MPTTDSRRWWALGFIALAQFMVIMDTSIIGVALPEIQADLGFDQNSLSWVFNAYVIAFGGLLLLSRTVSLKARMLAKPAARAISAIGSRVVSINSLAVWARCARASASGPAPSSASSCRSICRTLYPNWRARPGRRRDPRPRRRSDAWRGRPRRRVHPTAGIRGWGPAGSACTLETPPAVRRPRWDRSACSAPLAAPPGSSTDNRSWL